jgi:hypothetical protein
MKVLLIDAFRGFNRKLSAETFRVCVDEALAGWEGSIQIEMRRMNNLRDFIFAQQQVGESKYQRYRNYICVTLLSTEPSNNKNTTCLYAVSVCRQRAERIRARGSRGALQRV